jgi:hypothetical protein
MPHTALPSVNQSAKWNSRIIEKGLGLLGDAVVSIAFLVSITAIYPNKM